MAVGQGSAMTRSCTAALLAAAMAACAPIAPIGAQPLAISLRNTAPMATTTTDQFGQLFTVTGMSGITWAGGENYLAVMDNSNKVVRIRVRLNDDGSIASADFMGGVRLADSRDFEGIAYTDKGRNSVFLSEEGTPAVHEYSLATGARLRTFETPPVFTTRRANNGLESLTRHPLPEFYRGELWTANEEALTVDGSPSTASAGTTVRLLHYSFTRTTATPTEQYAYLTQPLHGTPISGSKGGLSDMLMLDDGRLLTLERSLAFSLSGVFQSRIYELDFTSATEISGFTSGLIGQTYTPVAKRLLWTGSLTNLEGLALGPALANGRRVIIGIVDDGDTISTNMIVAFELSGDLHEPAVSTSPAIRPAPPDVAR